MKMPLAGNSETTIICCYSPTNTTDNVEEVTRFYNDLGTIASAVSAHNCLIVCSDYNAHLGPEKFQFTFHKDSNENGRRLIDFLDQFNLFAANTKFQNRPGKLWTHRYPNDHLAQLDYVLENGKIV